MKLLILCHKMPFPPVDGGSIASLNMIKGLSMQGNKVSVIAMQTPKHNSSLAEVPEELKNTIVWESVKVNTKIRPLPLILNLLFSKKAYNGVRFESKDFEQKLVSHLSTHTYDIVQLEGLYLGSYIDVVRANSKAKIVFRPHNVEAEIWSRLAAASNSSLKRLYFKILSKRIHEFEKEVLAKVDAVVAMSTEDEKQLLQESKTKSFISPVGLSDAFLSTPIVAKESNNIGFIGALDWMPNTEGLMWFLNGVWEPLGDKHNFTLNVAGRGGSKSFEKELSCFQVNYKGKVDSALQFIDEQGIVIVPLLSGSGIRIKILEAMARAKCVLTTKVGAQGLDLNHGEHIYIADTEKEQRELLLHLINHPKLVRECGQKARAFVIDKYTNASLAHKLNKFYKQELV